MKSDALAIMLGKPSSGEEEGDSETSLDAAKDVLEAVSDKDPKALDLALKRHYELCAGGEDETDEE